MKNAIVIAAVLAAAAAFFYQPKASWRGALVPQDPVQSSADAAPWSYKGYTVLPRAKYHLRAVILSKHRYWGWGAENELSSHDLALGWGPMSDSGIINQLKIFQLGRWYYFFWKKKPPIDPFWIMSHSSNNHIIAGTSQAKEALGYFKRYEVVELQGYLVDIQRLKDRWSWHTSLIRTDTGSGSCEIFWVTGAYWVQ